MSDKARSACPVCGRATVTMLDGRIGKHGPQEAPCRGWGHLPKERRP